MPKHIYTVVIGSFITSAAFYITGRFTKNPFTYYMAGYFCGVTVGLIWLLIEMLTDKKEPKP
jgi:Na+-transporting NADH:ubiquinone oxidoreductase subunit NqrB